MLIDRPTKNLSTKDINNIIAQHRDDVITSTTYKHTIVHMEGEEPGSRTRICYNNVSINVYPTWDNVKVGGYVGI